MKKLILSFFSVVLLLISLHAQNDDAVISNDKIAIVYIGIENPISVAIPDIKSENVVLSVNFGTIEKREGLYYLTVPDSRGMQEYVTVTAFEKKENGETVNHGSKNFRILNIPMPKLMVNGLNGGDISVSDAQKLDSLWVELPCFVYEGFNYEVQNFKLIINRKKKNYMFNIKGTKFPVNATQELSTVKKGDIIIIDDIYAKLPYLGIIKRMPQSVIFKVK